MNDFNLNNYDWWQRPRAEAEPEKGFRNSVSINMLRGVPNVAEVSIRVQSKGGGLNRVWGNIRQPGLYLGAGDLDRVTSSSLLTSDPGIVSLPALTTTQTVGVTDSYPLCHANVFNTCVIANGSTANNALLKEVSSTDPSLTALTYTPGSVINHLDVGPIAGAASAEKLFVSRLSAAVEVLTDASSPPTSAGAMNAATSGCWGILFSPINSSSIGAKTLLIYAGRSLMTLDSTAAIGTAPTTSGLPSALPNGGFPVGIGTLPGVPTSAYYWLPKQDLAYSTYASRTAAGTAASFVSGSLTRFNLEALDMQNVSLPIRPVFAWQVDEQTIWVSNGAEIWEVSDKVRSLHWATARSQDSNTQNTCFGGWSVNGVPHVLSVNDTVTAAGGLIRVEKYVRSTNSWHQVSADVAQGSSFTLSLSDLPSWTGASQLIQLVTAAPGALPYSSLSHNLHWTLGTASGGAGTGQHVRQYAVPEEYPLFYTRNQTASAGATTGQQVESSGSYTSPANLIEGIEGAKLVLEEMACYGDLAAGGTDCTFQLQVAAETSTGYGFSNNLTRTFQASARPSTYVEKFPTNRDFTTRFQYKATITRGANAYKSPNILPLQFKFLAFLDGKVRSPAEVRAEEAAANTRRR